MITEPHLMPDFRNGLEQALYLRASAAAVPAPTRRLPRVVPRPALAGRVALGLAVLVVAIAVALTSLPGRKASHTAFAEPLILTSSPTEPVPPGLTTGVLAKDVLGADAEFDRVIPLNVFGTQAYLAKARTGWCLIPTTAITRDINEISTRSCATTHDLERVGIAVITHGTYVAALPPGAKAPVLQQRDGATRPVSVSPLGVAAVTGLKAGDEVTREGLEGPSITDVER